MAGWSRTREPGSSPAATLSVISSNLLCVSSLRVRCPERCLKMATSRRVLWACLALLANRALADCTCSGLDYTNGGSYLIDGSSDRQFVFTSQFEG